MALYLDHRYSTDFVFATPESVVDLDFARRIPWLSGESFMGGPGMVDVELRPRGGRRIKVSFQECGWLIPQPSRKPVPAPNGFLVAHPVDLLSAKMRGP